MADVERLDEILIPDHGPDCYELDPNIGGDVVGDILIKKSVSKKRGIRSVIEDDVLDESVLIDIPDTRQNSPYIDPGEN